ncbi:MAG: MarR family transcriptional regulator [Deltaproteobacteria bacterium]|nr:MarR family transcriptional regulator [Deltaproteobacteria bacterium]
MEYFYCFRIGALARKIYRHYGTLYGPYGVTVPQSFVIFDLLAHEYSSVKDIAARVQLDSPAVTGIVDRLVKEGLVRREEDPADRRSLRVSLTEKGRALGEELVPLAVSFNRQLHDALKADDTAAFERSLKLLEEKLT